MAKTRRANSLIGLIRLLGFRKDNFSRSVLPYLVFTLSVCAAAVFLLNRAGAFKEALLIWKGIFPVLWYIPVFAAAEELLLRGATMPVLVTKMLRMSKAALVNSLLNGGVYLAAALIIPWTGDHKTMIMLWSFPAGFVSGLLFSLMYYNYPNIYLALLSRLVILSLIPAACAFMPGWCR